MAALEWTKHDDTSYYLILGGVLSVTIVYDRVGKPGWKVAVANRSLRDKLPSKEDAQKVAIAYAKRIIAQCVKELGELMPES